MPTARHGDALVRNGVVARPSDAALWRAVVATLGELRDLPADPGLTRLQHDRLIALGEYAGSRGPDPTGSRRADVRRLLGDDSPTAVLLDPDDPRRSALRRALVAHLDADLASERALLADFQAPGNRPDAGPPPDSTASPPVPSTGAPVEDAAPDPT